MTREKNGLQWVITALPRATTGHRWREDVGVNARGLPDGVLGKPGGNGLFEAKGWDIQKAHGRAGTECRQKLCEPLCSCLDQS